MHEGWRWTTLGLIVLIMASAMTSTVLAPRSVSAQISTAGKIIFVSDRDGNNEIYIMNIDSSNQVNLTHNPASDWHPRWSPDGKRIAFASKRDGEPEIYVMSANGENPFNLTNNPGADYWPEWSPDGKHIAFISERDGNQEIYIMDANGRNQINLTNDPVPDKDPAWSPDGTRIAFISKRGGYPWSMFHHVYVMNADGTRVNRAADIPPIGDAKYLSDWSPDGGNLAVTYKAPLCPLELYLLEVKDGYSFKIRENASYGSFSPDSSQLVASCVQDNNWEICLLDISTEEIVSRLTNNSAADWDPDWKPEVVPVAPGGLHRQSVSSSEIRLGWFDTSENEAGFSIERKESSGTWKEIANVGANIITYRDSHLFPEKSYAYRVRAYNNAGTSDYSNVVTITTLANPTAKEARSNIDIAMSSISQEKSRGFDIRAAEHLLYQAEQALKEGRYDTALALARKAAGLALDVDQDGVPNEKDFAPGVKNGYIYAGIVVSVLGMLLIAIYMYNKRRRQRAEEQKITEKEKAEIINMIDKALEEKKR